MKIDQPRFEAIGQDITTMLESLNKTIEGVDKVVDHFDADVTPELWPAMVELHRPPETASKVIGDTDTTLLGTDAPGKQDLERRVH